MASTPESLGLVGVPHNIQADGLTAEDPFGVGVQFINGTSPIVGPYLSEFLRAGPYFGATTLSRFYAIHMLLLPGLIGALIGFHLYLVAKLGTTAPPWLRSETKPKSLREKKV